MIDLLPPPLSTLAARVISENRERGRTVAVAESCTGGLVSAALTEIPGSSAVIQCGFVTYSNAAKATVLGVSDDLIDTFGAVSIAVAWEMACGALDRADCDVAVAITGIAGPDGGTEHKPVGTVMFAKAERDADRSEAIADQYQFGAEKTRADIRLQAALTALELLLPDGEGAREDVSPDP